LATERTCALETCLAPEEIGCNRGFEFLEDCPKWTGGQRQESSSENNNPDPQAIQRETKSELLIDGRQLRLPWTGNSLGLLDLELVTACNKTTLLGVVGPYNSGKTTLLTLIYLLIQRGEQSAIGIFAGSYSLIGWENLAAHFRWRPGEGGPTFPPHTSRMAGRRPGLLHVALRDRQNIRHDFLFTDPPGEWFNVWAQKESAEGADGARWVQQHADRFIFLVDREALASNERGKARDAFRDLARRLSVSLRGRPVAVVWTKSDISVSATIEHDLRDCFAIEFPGHSEFHIQVRFGDEKRDVVEEPCLRLMKWAFARDQKTRRIPLALPIYDESDLFLAYRGRSEHL
jgi:hypothetical protein